MNSDNWVVDRRRNPQSPHPPNQFQLIRPDAEEYEDSTNNPAQEDEIPIRMPTCQSPGQHDNAAKLSNRRIPPQSCQTRHRGPHFGTFIGPTPSSQSRSEAPRDQELDSPRLPSAFFTLIASIKSVPKIIPIHSSQPGRLLIAHLQTLILELGIILDAGEGFIRHHVGPMVRRRASPLRTSHNTSPADRTIRMPGAAITL